jgi:NTP pyrophosphatase (non-canonical NTP hydrolase)
MSTLDQLQTTIGTWAETTFPDHTIESYIRHLREEVEELDASHHEGNLIEEAADCLILLLSLAHFVGCSLEDAVVVKHGRNTRRHWGPPDEHGVVHHTEHSSR